MRPVTRYKCPPNQQHDCTVSVRQHMYIVQQHVYSHSYDYSTSASRVSLRILYPRLDMIHALYSAASRSENMYIRITKISSIIISQIFILCSKPNIYLHSECLVLARHFWCFHSKHLKSLTFFLFWTDWADIKITQTAWIAKVIMKILCSGIILLYACSNAHILNRGYLEKRIFLLLN